MDAHEDPDRGPPGRGQHPIFEGLSRVALGAAATGMLVIVTLATLPSQQLDSHLKLAIGQAAWVIAGFLSAWFVIQADVPLVRGDATSLFWRFVVGFLTIIGVANLNDVFGSLLLHFEISDWKVTTAKMMLALSGMIYVFSPKMRLKTRNE